jgi:glycosyltransferase involved in cell wall biosynthesis
MIKLSVVIITYNEDKNIERCLQSIQEIADEVIVVDSFSTDKTKIICEQYQVDFSCHTFEGHIEQKNYALSLAQHQWVLSLDADEALSEAMSQFILDFKHQPDADGYSFNRLNNFCGQWIKHCGWYPDKKLRLFNKEKGHWGGTNPHDKVMMDKNAKIKHIEADILHYSFYSVEQHIDQINKFSTIKAKAAFNKNKRFYWFKLFVFPLFKFIRAYLIKLGFLDGFLGFIISYNTAYSEYLKWIKLRLLRKQNL